MQQISAKEARLKWSALLDQVEAGEEICIVRRNKAIAKIVQINTQKKQTKAPSLKEFRNSIQSQIKGRTLSLSKTISQLRRSERF